MPRYQYSNYSVDVVSEADVIHCYVKDFLLRRSERATESINVYDDRSRLFESLSRIKGVGPLSFNQFWHSLCLCGVLPINYINTTGIAIGSGPAKLIQTYYPECKSADSMDHILHKVKSTITKMGINTVTDFFIENMMCELTRLGNKSKLATTKMKAKDKMIGFASDTFFDALRNVKPSKNPDLYFRSPCTGEYQHMFRVVEKDLLMRLSFVENDIASSVMLKCYICHDQTTGAVDVSWKGNYVKRNQRSPRSWFYPE
jgi:hypothetical protein